MTKTIYQIAHSNNYNEIKQMFLFNEDYLIKNPSLIEKIYGIAIFYSNVKIISLTNLFVKENKIKIDKLNVLSEIYAEYNRKMHHELDKMPTRKACIEYSSFDELKIQLKYIHLYWNIFEQK